MDAPTLANPGQTCPSARVGDVIRLSGDLGFGILIRTGLKAGMFEPFDHWRHPDATYGREFMRRYGHSDFIVIMSDSRGPFTADEKSREPFCLESGGRHLFLDTYSHDRHREGDRPFLLLPIDEKNAIDKDGPLIVTYQAEEGVLYRRRMDFDPVENKIVWNDPEKEINHLSYQPQRQDPAACVQLLDDPQEKHYGHALRTGLLGRINRECVNEASLALGTAQTLGIGLAFDFRAGANALAAKQGDVDFIREDAELLRIIASEIPKWTRVAEYRRPLMSRVLPRAQPAPAQ